MARRSARAGAEKIGWERRSSLAASTRGVRKKGLGVALVIHSCGSNPAGISEAEVTIDGAGRISLFSGTADQGSEQQTTLRQMVAEILGVSLDDGRLQRGHLNLSVRFRPFLQQDCLRDRHRRQPSGGRGEKAAGARSQFAQRGRRCARHRQENGLGASESLQASRPRPTRSSGRRLHQRQGNPQRQGRSPVRLRLRGGIRGS